MVDELVLEVDELSVAFRSGDTWRDVVRAASFDVRRGEILALVGESGSGKSVTAMTTIGLSGWLGARVSGGRVRFDGADVIGLSEREWLAIRGRRIGMIFQQPTRSLDPAFTVGEQIAETVRYHLGQSRRDAWDTAVRMLDRVGIAGAARRAQDYPHMFSGGMCQRVMIASALACRPTLLIADEPTTALDVTVQAKVLDLLREIQREEHLSVLYITHDLGVVAQLCDRVAVMYAGEVVEQATVDDVFCRPRHPYTEGLLASIPRRGRGRRMVAIPGQVPAPHRMPDGCRFHPRCAYAEPGICTEERIQIRTLGTARTVRCARIDELTLEGIRG